ncbi:MAG TPA: DUF883 family protein [Candidatus Limnocylindria bacterium]|nr:DUF883 family protein [Candidatus Limnocylindria bacterium]
MNKHKRTATNDMSTLAEDARALLVATSEVAGEKVSEARDRLSAALDRGKEMYGDAKDRAVAGAKAGDKFVRTNPYAAVGIALGVGALIGIFMCRRKGD